MTVRNLIKLGIKKLSKTSPSVSIDAEVILSHVMDRPKEYLYANMNTVVSPKQKQKYVTLLGHRLQGWPVAYLSKKKEFYKLQFYVDRNVLIPRPETEGLIDLAIQEVKEMKNLKIVDMGTGSGNIIISLAKILGKKNLYFASDLSPKALFVAKKNAGLHKVKVKFARGSLLKPWKSKHFDIIMANLPYGWKQWKNNTTASTIGLQFEPHTALFTQNRGLLLITKLLEQISQRKTFPAFIFLEFDPRQVVQIKKLAAKLLPTYSIKIYKDLFGRNRCAVLKQL